MPDAISESYAVLVNALLRFLLCLSPWRAEGIYYMSHVAPPLRAKGWTKVTTAGHTGWIFLDRDAGTGKHSSTSPAGIDPTQVPTIVIPPHYQFGLRDMAKQLVEQSGAATINPALDNLYSHLVSMGDGTFETAEIARFLDLCRGAAGSPATFKKALADYRTELLQGMCNTHYPSYFVGLMALFLNSIAGIEAIVLTGVQIERGQLPHLMALLKFAVDSIVENDGLERLERAAADLRAEGKSHLEQADMTRKDEVFYGHLFMSCPFFYGAKQEFQYLAAQWPAGSDARKSYEKKEYECEELLVYSSSSLLNHFDNLHYGWAQFRKHCRRISDLRKAKGDAAAERQAIEYLTLSHFYPSHYRDSLLQGLPAPPERDGTSGGAHIGHLCGVIETRFSGFQDTRG